MNFSLPFTIVIAAVMLVSTAIDKKFRKPPEETIVQPPAAAVLPVDTIEIVPPLVTEPPEGSGFRVQLFVSNSEDNAKKFQEQIKYMVPYPSHLFVENSEYKVRVGDFRRKSEADSLASIYQKGEFPDAWVVECPISVTKAGYRVQLAVLRSLNSAAAYARMMEKNVEAPLYIVREEGVWKVRAGDFISKEQADALKNHLTEKGYSGLFVAEDRVY